MSYQRKPGPSTVATSALVDGNVTEAKLATGLSVPVPVVATASLPAPDGKARFAKETDGIKGIKFSNGSQWYDPFGEVLTLEQFGGKADGTTDNLAAWNAAFSAMSPGADFYAPGKILQLGSGTYLFSDTPHVTRSAWVRGVGGAQAKAATVIKGAIGKTGMMVDYNAADGGSGIGCRLEGFQLENFGNIPNAWQASHAYSVGDIIRPTFWQGYIQKCTTAGTSSGTEPTNWPTNIGTARDETVGQTTTDGGVTWTAAMQPGLWVLAACEIRQVTAEYFAGDGIHIYGSVSSSNANGMHVDHVWCSNNLSDGLLIYGNDSNSGVLSNVQTNKNGFYGVHDYSFLGNKVTAGGHAGNGIIVWYIGRTVVAGDLVSPTIPNGYGYVVTVGGTTSTVEPTWPTTVGDTVSLDGITYKCAGAYFGGAYYLRSSDGDAIYTEGDGQQPIIVGQGARDRGGTKGTGYLPDWAPGSNQGDIVQARGNRNSFTVISDDGTHALVDTTVGNPGSSQNALSFKQIDRTSNTEITASKFSLGYRAGGATNNGFFWLDSSGNPAGFGLADGTEAGTVQGQAQFPSGFWLGGPAGPSGGSFVDGSSSRTTAPTGGQNGDLKVVRSQTGAGVGTWHNIGTSASDGNVPRWTIGVEAGAFHPIDISATSVGSPYVMTRGDHNAVFHNNGASVKSAVTLRAADDFPYAREKFINNAATGMRLVAQSGTKIAFGRQLSSNAGYIETFDLGATMTVECLSGRYFVVASEGLWNIDGVPVYADIAAFNASLVPSGTTQTVDLSTGRNQNLSLASASGDVTLTLTNPTNGAEYCILVTQGATPRNIIWPANVKWPGGVAPTITITNGSVDKISLKYDGTNHFGSFAQNF